MGEFKTIEMIRKLLGKTSADVLIGIGDDAAVVRSQSDRLVVTVDCQVEGVHFSRKLSRPEELGHKLLAVNLSDMAAMGAVPKWAVVSLALTSQIDDTFIRGFYRGLRGLARRHGVEVVGGNLSRSRSDCFFDLTLLGTGNGKGPLLTRAGARAGDFVFVAGALGDSAAGFAALQKWGRAAAQERFAGLVRSHVRPIPLVDFGKALRGVATSCLDISDGLSSELHHLAKASGSTLVIREAQVPVSAAAQELAAQLRTAPLQWSLHGGENYSLLFTTPARSIAKLQKLAGRHRVPLHAIGFVLKGRPQVRIQNLNGKIEPLKAAGWTHF